MALIVEKDPVAIVARLRPVVAADPVRHTILATIAHDVGTGSAGWCAHDGSAVAARSDAARPLAVTGGWADLPALAAALPATRALGGPPPVVARLVELLDRPVVDVIDERLFRCDRVRAPAGVPGAARRATPADAELLAAWRAPYLVDVFGRVPPGTDLAAWSTQALAGGTWMWVDPAGRPVAHAAVRPPQHGVVRIGPVYTPPEHRGHGYASAVTAHAATEALASGAVPVLMTDLANPTSNRIYEAIGFRPVEDRTSVWFE